MEQMTRRDFLKGFVKAGCGSAAIALVGIEQYKESHQEEYYCPDEKSIEFVDKKISEMFEPQVVPVKFLQHWMVHFNDGLTKGISADEMLGSPSWFVRLEHEA